MASTAWWSRWASRKARCVLRTKAQTLIHDARVPFKLLIDTFHHHLYPQAADEFSQVEVADIGLVHLSGVDDSRPREQLTDAERIMLTPQDRLGACRAG